MKTKSILSIILGSIYLFAMKIFAAFQGSFEATTAVTQLEDNTVSYGISNLIVDNNIYTATHLIFWGLIGIIWIPVIIKYIKKLTQEEN